MNQRRYKLSDEQWEQIQDLFPFYRTGCPPQLFSRTVLNAILWIACSGDAWRDLVAESIVHGKPYTAAFVSGETLNF